MPIGKHSVPVPVPVPQNGQHKSGFRRGVEAMYTSRSITGALDFIDELGLQLPEKPQGPDGQALEPKLPADITKLSNVDLGRLMGEFAALQTYASAHLGLSDIEHTDVDYTYEMTEATQGLHIEGSNKDARTYQLRLNQQVRASRDKAIGKRARKVLLGKLIDGYERAINTLSREMSRRQSEMEKKL